MISASSINRQVILQVLNVLNGIGKEFVGNFDINKINIEDRCPGGEVANISTKDSYDDSGNLKPDGKPDSMTICLDKLVSGISDSIEEWRSEFPNLNDSWEHGVDRNFLKSPL